MGKEWIKREKKTNKKNQSKTDELIKLLHIGALKVVYSRCPLWNLLALDNGITIRGNRKCISQN